MTTTSLRIRRVIAFGLRFMIIMLATFAAVPVMLFRLDLVPAAVPAVPAIPLVLLADLLTDAHRH